MGQGGGKGGAKGGSSADDWGEDEESGGDPNGNPVSSSWDTPGMSSVPSTPSPVGATGYHQSDSPSLAPLTLSSSGFLLPCLTLGRGGAQGRDCVSAGGEHV